MLGQFVKTPGNFFEFRFAACADIVVLESNKEKCFEPGLSTILPA
jgi:hypothetical protein